MSNLSNISGQNIPNLQDVLTNLPTSIKELTPEELQQLSDLLNISTVSKSDLEKDLSILAMMPVPWISPMVINQIFQDPKNAIGLQGVIDAITGTKASQTENSVVLAGLAAWLKSTEEQAMLAKEAMLRAAPSQSLNTALKSYVENQGSGATDPIQMLQFLRSNPVLVSALQSVDPGLLTKALHIAESQIVIQILDKMIADQAISNEIAKRQAIQQDIKTTSERDDQIRQQILKDYVDEVQRKKAETGQNDTSMLAMMLVQAVMLPVYWGGVISAPTPTLPTDDITKTIQSIAPTASEEMNVSMQMVAQAASQMACYFCIPVLIQMLGNNADLPEKEVSIKTVRAYVLTLISMLGTTEFEALLAQIATKNVANPASITEDRLKSWIAVMKVALLVNCLAALEKIEIGHLTADGLMSMLLGNTAIPPGDYLRALIIKLFREQFKLIPESERDKFLQNICMYYEKNPEIESLLNPAKSFVALCNPNFFRQTAQAQTV